MKTKTVRDLRQRRGKRWDPEEHLRWLKEVWGNRTFGTSDAALAHDRADRWEKGPRDLHWLRLG
jgi:hypothetical protein